MSGRRGRSEADEDTLIAADEGAAAEVVATLVVVERTAVTGGLETRDSMPEGSCNDDEASAGEATTTSDGASDMTDWQRGEINKCMKRP